ncbi:MAG TPA: IucA/IucC family protein [Pseudonocardiaceae bacterium]|jgi:siderophore synthetase component|nr:IucA/IucC family protein [Pseudonocardiaceae bacterium]
MSELLRAVLNTLLREDFAGIRSHGSVVAGRLRIAEATEIPVRPDGFLCDLAVAEPVVCHDGRRLDDLTSVLALLRRRVDPVDLPGFDEFTRECHAAEVAERTQRTAAPSRPDGRPWTGMTATLRYDGLAALAGHPVYPTGNARVGISPADQLRYAPEYQATFAPNWTAVPADRVHGVGELPAWWPTAPDHVLFPVHPLTGTGTPGDIPVLPTLSMRTVAVVTDPHTHLKLPLPTSSLGARNRRTIKPGTLVDGAVTERLLAAIVRREPAFAGRIVLADEQTYRHADDELLAFLVRRYPADLATAEVVPLAALMVPAVLDDLADREHHGDRLAFLAACLGPLLDFQTTLLLRYGVALESHQQNVSLVLGADGVRLLFKDNDGVRLRADRLLAAFDGDVPRDADPALLADRRILVPDTEPLIDLFTTITLHLCAAAIVFALPHPERRGGLALIRELLAAAIDRNTPSDDANRLRAATLDADRLPIKAMVTAGTLLTKERSGASDINKFYLRDGPNYLSARPFTNGST